MYDDRLVEAVKALAFSRWLAGEDRDLYELLLECIGHTIDIKTGIIKRSAGIHEPDEDVREL